MKLVEFDKEHLKLIKYRNIDMSFTDIINEVPERNTGPAYTLMTDSGQVVGCAGVNTYWPGVGEAWAILSDLIHKYPLSFHRTVVKMLNQIQTDYKLNRIQATCLQGFNRAEKWLIALGFEYEGTMRKYGPGGEDHYRYARVR